VTGARRDDIPYDHLYLDNERAVRKLIRYFVSRGHSRMGFVGGLPENMNIQQRVRGFELALADENLECGPAAISLGAPDLDSVTQRTHQYLRSSDRPSAVICTSDMIAMVVIRAAIELGLRVPQDIAVAGFDDITQASLTTPSVTTIRQPLRAMSQDIVSMLLSRLESPKTPIREKQYEAELILREST
ncbi:MAG: LacI family DNA-binding transcriptional regulator, partial [Puniceicoccales bacterium]